jgi:hypothetical protein
MALVAWEPAWVTWLDGLRQREVQALGAALSRRNWQETEMAYSQLRDAIDHALIETRRKNPPLTEHEQWQHME